MNQVDETIRALLAVYRDELNRRDRDIEDLQYGIESAKGKAETLDRNLTTEEARSSALAERNKKLERVIESLKIELADARQQAANARDDVSVINVNVNKPQ